MPERSLGRVRRLLLGTPFVLSNSCFAMLCILQCPGLLHAQSTFGTVLGTVVDPSGSVIGSAKVELLNTGTNAVRGTESSVNGSYQFNNVEVGTYKIRVDATGFQKADYQAFDLTARATVHVDLNLQLATQSSAVEVTSTVSAVQTDVSSTSETKGSRELTDLPVAVYTRSQGSTSAYATLTAQPGVQTDNSNNIVVAGALPSMISINIDGISATGPGYGASGGYGDSSMAELFPSFYAIEEIKISETLNPAEFGGVADITTVSKAGTNSFHGGLFENVQNTDFNASDTFSHQPTPVQLNNFGVYLGGPIIIPGLYNGRNKTFFFGSFEVLRLPKSQTALLSVPSAAMRNGDLSAYDGTIIPASQINPFSAKLLDLFYPLPNYGPPGAVSNNYLANYSIPINSAQGDVRLDQAISPKHLVYARYTYKNRRLTTAPYGPPTLGEVSRPELYNAFTIAENWIISPSLVNEFRGGLTTSRSNITSPITGTQAAAELGLTYPPLPGPIPGFSTLPTVSIAGYEGIFGPATNTNPKQKIEQIADTLTWTKGKHTMKFGGDIRALRSLYTAVFGQLQLGDFAFNGSAGLGYSPFAGFLLGYPDSTQIAAVINPSTDAHAKHFAFFGQDDWKVSRSLTINFGMRWEYNPAFKDSLNDTVNWDPNYSSVVNGATEHGAVIIPNQASYVNVNPEFAAEVAPTPIILASQVGIPSTLRTSSKEDFAPRIGFAYSLGGNNKTVIRGGYGRFIEALQGSSANHGWSVGAAAYGYFANSIGSNGLPVFQMPYSYPSDIAVSGAEYFSEAVDLHFKDPIVEEWNLTMERDLGKGFGVRASYDGNHSYNVPVLVNANQILPNTLGFFATASQAAVPFPQMAYIATQTNQGFGNYNAGTVSAHKRSGNLQVQASYTYTRNLSNTEGYGGGNSAAAFPGEFGSTMSSSYRPGLDYGNVPFSRRNRFLATFLYELPFGKGKTFLNNLNPVADRIVGGFQLSGILLFQSGPFMSVTTLDDPSGVGFNVYNANGGRADTVSGVNPYQGQSLNQWINPAAFVDPGNNIGRFGDSLSGAVQGPSTKAVSMSLLKTVAVTEHMQVQIGAQVSNLFNHPNYAPPPNLTLGVPAFGTITGMQTAEGAGPRQIQLTGRFVF
jgi:hypothetical protein